MKKKLAIIVASVMLVSMNTGMTALAVSSPTGTATSAAASGESPKTGETNMLYMELAGVALAATAFVAKKRSKQIV